MKSENTGLGTVALTSCYFCGGDNEIILATHARSGRFVAEANGKVLNTRPCNKCEGYMKMGVIIITIDPEKSSKGWEIPPTNEEERQHWMPNPWRTGGWFVVTDGYIKRVFGPESMLATTDAMLTRILERRFTFMDHAIAEKLGLFGATPTHKE